ncbi:MAG: hypothetical protein AAGL24_10130 [Pseudomonadota bacterium]
MATPPIPATESQHRKDTIEQALRDGFNPYRVQRGGHGSAVREAERRLRESGHLPSNSQLDHWVRRQEKECAAGRPHFLPDWSLFQAPGIPPAAASGTVRRFLLTAAQDDTVVHERFWGNLNAYAAVIGAEIMVGGFTYQKGLYEDHRTLTASYVPAVQPFLRHAPVDLGEVLFVADVNILPTAVDPLSGLDTHSRGRPAVFPHAKIRLKSVPTLVGDYTPVIMTTGACTVENYIQKKAGIKARFHHVIGATVVEIDAAGRWFMRTISAAADGSFQDLDAIVVDGRVSRGNRVKAITWGDIHVGTVPDPIAALSWGIDPDTGLSAARADAVIDALRPEYQFFHDLLDFPQSSRHTDGDPHHWFEMVTTGRASMQDHVADGARFLRAAGREFCRSVVVESNHDERLARWMREPGGRSDPINLRYWHECNLAQAHATEHGDADFNLVRWALAREDPAALAGIDFVPVGGSFVLCQDRGGIECGPHGHLGPNGSRGAPQAHKRTASRMNIGHLHAPEIVDGVYVAGVNGSLDQGYNKGASSWAHADIVTYGNAKRTILIKSRDGAWRA